MYNKWKGLFLPAINKLGKAKEKQVFDQAPIFLGGCGRSGTTLLLSMISASPEVFCFPHEVDAFTQWNREDGNLVPRRIDRLYRYLLTHSVPSSCNRWCEKRPFNVRYIPEILEYFGNNARFVHIIRDARDVLTSRHPEKPDEYWVESDRWINDVTIGLNYRDNEQVYTLKYENLINDYESTMKSLCSFLNIEFGDEMLNWFDHAKVRSNRAWFSGVKKLHNDSIKSGRSLSIASG